ncbi:type 1 glutamine amidotransferase family protein [Lignipirellula cremea]|nr:hypothetical protein [Lignipirellula cremea]
MKFLVPFSYVCLSLFACLPLAAQEPAPAPVVVVAEGERFQPAAGEAGWQVMHQDQSYATQNFGAMWVTHGGLVGAPAASKEAVAVQKVTIPANGSYRVWSKYQSPPYYNFVHRVEVWQGNRKVFSHDYGKVDALRMYSFCGASTYNLPPQKQLWFPWGVDHDAAEAPKNAAQLKAGPAEIRLITVDNPEPAGDRYVDFVLLTSSTEDTCIGWEKHGQAKSPFIYEAIRSTPLYFRFKNTARTPVKAKLFTHFGHFTWHCAPKHGLVPEAAVSPGAWSPWVNINQVVELLTDEGLQVTLVDGELDSKAARTTPAAVGGSVLVPVQVALDSAGRQVLGELDVPNGETIHFPIDITWNKEKTLRLSRDIAADLIAQSKTEWRKAFPTKPKLIPFYGGFDRGGQPWALALKDALGYNTQLPAPYQTLKVDGYHQHLRNEQAIKDYAAQLGAQKGSFRVCSFGDEITIGGVKLDDPQYLEPFRAWLQKHRLTREDLGVDPRQATPGGNARLQWYGRLFGAEQRFEKYRQLTAVAKQAFGPQVLTGANFSPHHGVMYYGDQLQWIDAFKHQAMSMFWAEDYLFFVPELPQTISFMFARMRSATKYHNLPIHMYIMPHSPGQPADYFRRNSLLAIGAGAKHIDHFWVGPQENYSENYVSWQYPEMFQAIFESTYDTAAVESLLDGAQPRRARVAVVTGKATALNEDHAAVNTAADRFLRMSHLAGKPVQNICRKDQQLIYLALRQAQYQVDLITEDDIVESKNLDQYRAIYFAGEWVNDKAVPRLEKWVTDGGVLYASTGLGHLNQYNEPEQSLLNLLGVKAGAPKKNLYHHRPLLELPLADAITESHPDDLPLQAIAFQQGMQPTSPETRVLVRWKDGSAAVTERPLGRGKAYAVGSAMGAAFWKTALRPVPWARGGEVNLYNPTDFDPAAWKIMNLGVEAAFLDREATSSVTGVESLLLDNKQGTLLTLVNWTNNDELPALNMEVKSAFAPREVFSIRHQKPLDFTYERGKVRFQTDLPEADFIMLKK